MKLLSLALAAIALLACTSRPEEITPRPRHYQPYERFRYAELPADQEWFVALEVTLEPEFQEIQSAELPDAIPRYFPLPNNDYSNRHALSAPGQRMRGGYGMDTEGCTPEGLINANNLPRDYGWGISGGQFAYYQLRDRDYLHDPRDYGFIIAYNGEYYTVTFPSLDVMQVKRLAPPDMTMVPHCGPNDSWRSRFGEID